MDEPKDSQNSGQLAQFFDEKTVRTNPFGANQSADRVYRRAERIVAALYLITNHVLPQESLRTSIRAEAILMLGKTLSLRDDMRAIDSEHVEDCQVSIRYLISLVRMLSVAGLVSTHNTNVVVEGLDELGNFIAVSKNSTLSENTTLSRDDLLDIHGPSVKDIKDKPYIKDSIKMSNKIMSSTSSSSDGLSVRELSIMAILRSGGEFGIKDIASNLPEYSEKMIQRDLMELIVAGRVKKVGLKRWSRYSVIS